MENNYDLTTKEGMRNAAVILAPVSFVGFLVQKVVKTFTTQPTKDEQIKMAKELIEKAKETNAKELNITVDNSVGAELKAENIQGTSFNIGKSGKTTINVKW